MGRGMVPRRCGRRGRAPPFSGRRSPMSTAPTSNGNTPEAHERTKAEGRDARGRFVKGNAGGPGNPFAGQTARLRRVLLEEISEADLRQVVFTLVLRAKAGNLHAIKLVLQYAVGKPTEMSEPEGL